MADNQVLGMGRLVGDGAIDFYLQDIIVRPHYQCNGVGSAIVNRLLFEIKEIALPETSVVVCQFSAQGRESFYQKFGFRERPNAQEGPGMMLNIISEKSIDSRIN